MLEIALRGDEGFHANLCINQRTIRRFSPLNPTHICITNAQSADRGRVEHFIESRFHHSYGAEIIQHYPYLLSVHDDNDTILAALGFRYAQKEPLFLEHYLDEPVEQILSRIYRKEIDRKSIAEVGNLASLGQGGSIFLFAALNAYLDQQGIELDTFTATDFLDRYFRKLGLKAKELAKADQSRLLDNGASWGSYYEENPRVIAGQVKQVLLGLNKYLQIVLQQTQGDMHAKLHPQPDHEIGHA